MKDLAKTSAIGVGLLLVAVGPGEAQAPRPPTPIPGGVRAETVARGWLGERGERIRDVRQGPDGHPYLLTDHSDGRILRVVPAGR